MRSQDGVLKGGVYLLRIGPRKYYFGVATDFARRRREHLKDLRNGDHGNPILQRAYDKHGEGSFRFEPIVRCSREVAAKTEAWLIQSYVSDDNCVNLRIEDGTTYVHSEDTRRKISEANRGRVKSAETRRKLSVAQKAARAREGPRKLSAEHRRKIGEAGIGRTHSEETRRRLREARRRRAPVSEETRRKMSEAHRGKTLTAEHRRKIRETAMTPEVRLKLSEAAKRREAARRAAKANQVAECE